MIHSIALRLEKRENVVGWDVQVTTIVEESFIDRSTSEINRGELEGYVLFQIFYSCFWEGLF